MVRRLIHTTVFLAVLGTSYGIAYPKGIEMGLWGVVVSLPGGDLPFGLELLEEQGRPAAYYINGAERVKIDEVTIRGDSLVLFVPSFSSNIEAVLVNGALMGRLRLVKRGGKIQEMPLKATPGGSHRGGHKNAAGGFGGVWSVTFISDDGEASKAVGVFNQRGAKITGTFRTPTGDYRFLEGRVEDRDMYLSCFDGGHAFLFKASLNDDGDLEGDFWSGTQWHERWTAMLDPDAALPDPMKLTYLKPGHDTLEFRFPDLDGRPVALSDDVFRGKVVVVTIAGSWCPNCHDEASFLSPYYTKNRNRGLEVVALMYEHFKDFETAAQQVRHFRKRYRIEYTTLIAGYSSKTDAAKTLPALNHILAYPTTIVIDRRGGVRRITTGFDGPGTGEHFEKYQREFAHLIDRLLDE